MILCLFISLLLFSCYVQLFATPWTAACQASLSFTISWSLLKSIESVMLSNHLILCLPLLVPSIFPNTGVFSRESGLCIRWPKCFSQHYFVVFNAVNLQYFIVFFFLILVFAEMWGVSFIITKYTNQKIFSFPLFLLECRSVIEFCLNFVFYDLAKFTF